MENSLAERGGTLAAGRLAAVLSWQPALEQARRHLEEAGLTPEEAERLSRRIVVACAGQFQPASSEEAARLALEEAKTLALGLASRPKRVLARIGEPGPASHVQQP